MSKQSFNPRFLVLLAIILVAAAARVFNAELMSPLTSFSPVGAMAIFGGSYFNKQWKAFLFPLLALFLSDIIIDLFVYHRSNPLYGGWYWIYAIFLLMVVIGRLVIRKVTVKNVIIASVLATLLLWLLSDLKVWLGGGTDLRTLKPLTRDINGLIQCYIQGFPFMKNFLIGTLAYSGLMFGSFEWLKKYNPGWLASPVHNNRS